MKRVQLLDERQAEKINRRLDPLRSQQRTSSIGGRYFQGVPKIAKIRRLVSRRFFWDEAAALLGLPIGALCFLSLSALDVLPGDPGIGEHIDYPHHPLWTTPELCAQFVLSLDGTDEQRAPLWVGERNNLMCMQPGELLIFGGKALHGVHPNVSDRPRTTLLWSMGPYWIRPMERSLWSWIGGKQ